MRKIKKVEEEIQLDNYDLDDVLYELADRFIEIPEVRFFSSNINTTVILRNAVVVHPRRNQGEHFGFRSDDANISIKNALPFREGEIESDMKSMIIKKEGWAVILEWKNRDELNQIVKDLGLE